MTQRRIFGLACCVLGGFLLFCAAETVVVQDRVEEEAGKRTDALLPLVEQRMLVRSRSPSDAAEAGMPTDDEMPIAEINGHACIGMLHFPTLDLTLPILADCTETLLETAPCRQYGTAADDDLVIAGHNYRRHFKRLRELSVGDSIYFTDMNAKQHAYTVSSFETLLPTDLDRMLSGGWAMSLYTCTSGGEKRLTVRCVRQEESQT